ncbi:hypothetical protein BC351_30160 [Paenibacillus ferrarius]|uniref:Zinc-ribbon domain-containing protein n=1 Tax=Paenibacillus ferrarius TaxID=1469647 RepID=A0A1V4HHD7_9BACL|nr:zinc ribbon domain-containing protein [Paenibacillus ferrarius]OPH54987.1 hypothetical protein BC351_30160 [Paenibacillus ferrarius]
MFCNSCGKEVINESKFCNFCGNKLIEDDVLGSDENNEVEIVLQTKELNQEKLEITTKKSKKKKLMIVILISLLVIFGAGGGYWYYYNYQLQQKELKAQQQQKQLQEYKHSLGTATLNIVGYTVIAAQICDAYSKVWKESIDSRYGITTVNGKKAYDFNEALKYKREELKSSITKLDEKKEETDRLMQSLNNPPAEYQKAYDVLVQLYTLFTDFVSQADSPTGSLLTFNQKVNQLSSDIGKKVNEFKILLPSFDINQLSQVK